MSTANKPPPPPARVIFTRGEMHFFGYGGFNRAFMDTFNGLKPETTDKRRKMRKGLTFDDHILGMIAEAGTGKFLDLFASPKLGAMDTATGDLSGLIQVKGISQDDHSLIIRPDDPEGFRYVLAFVNLRHAWVDLLGWIYGPERKPHWREDDPGRNIRAAWFVPQNELRDMATLKSAPLTITQ